MYEFSFLFEIFFLREKRAFAVHMLGIKKSEKKLRPSRFLDFIMSHCHFYGRKIFK